MTQHTSPLDHVSVAAPCPAEWERMAGNERVRFCGQCSLNVYNLSGMTKREAEALITNTEGRLCVRFYRRADGSIITNNCPVGLRALKRRVSRIANAVASTVIGFLTGLGLYTGLRAAPQPDTPLMGAMAVEKVETETKETPIPPTAEPVAITGEFVMGKTSPTMLQTEEADPIEVRGSMSAESAERLKQFVRGHRRGAKRRVSAGE